MALCCDLVCSAELAGRTDPEEIDCSPPRAGAGHCRPAGARVPLADSSSPKGELGRARLEGAPSVISVNMNAVRKITLACIRPGRRRSCGNDGWSGLIRSSSSDLALHSKRRREAASAT
jgi:hypothetical protein